jgi:TolB-like protein
MENRNPGWFDRLRRRGVFRVAASYAVIAWLLLQIADVVLDPLGAPDWVMQLLIVLVAIGFPVALVLAWFFELTDHGIQRDRQAESEPRPAVHGARRYADLVVIGLLLAVIAFLLVRQQAPEQTFGDAPPVLAVLPFSEIGAAPDSPFGLGLADTLIHKLGQLGELVVLTSNSTFKFAGTSLDLDEVAGKLGASVLLEGTVQRATEMLRVNTRLVEARSGRQLWSGSYERSTEDLFAVQDEIALAVSEALSLVLTPPQAKRLVQPVTSSLTALDAYTLGRVKLAQRGQAIRDAIGFFRQAVELDSEFALAHAALAETLYMAPSYLRADTGWDQVAEEAWNAAKTAQRIDPGLGEGYLAEFYVAEADNRYGAARSWSDAELKSMLNRALARSPNNADAARYIARYAASAEERRRLLERAALLDPRSGIIAYDVSKEYAAIGDYEQAREWALRSGATAEPYFRIGYWNIGIIYAFCAGRLDDGARWMHLFNRSFGGPFEVSLYNALWDLGLMADARAVWDALRRKNDPSLEAFRLINEYIDAWREGQDEAANELWTRLETDFLRPHPNWPDLTRYPGSDWLMALRSISDLRAGDPARALARYRSAIPEPLRYPSTLTSGVFLPPPLMTAALLKANGQPEEGRALIQEFLAATEGEPISCDAGVGFSRFLAHGFLGDASAAGAEMQAILDAPFAAMSWQLEVARFDPDYAATLDSPEVAPLYAELQRRILAMRESYRQNPELPPEVVPLRFRNLPAQPPGQ